ncbi:MAG: hypothetical protein ACKO04_03995 [Actinomycetes bacterium]
MANKYRAWASGEVLTSANLIDFIQKNVVIPCDSSADYPDSTIRRQGMTIYDKTLNKLLVWTTTTTGWVPPWNLPWGVVTATAGGTSGYGYCRITTAQNGITTTATDVTNATVTFTAVAGRLYRVTASADLTQAATATEGQIQLMVDGTANATGRIAVSSTDKFANIATVLTLSAGSHTLKLQAQAIGGTINIVGSNAAPTILSIEDAGPVAAPTA